jgi:hypothetical protein
MLRILLHGHELGLPAVSRTRQAVGGRSPTSKYVLMEQWIGVETEEMGKKGEIQVKF